MRSTASYRRRVRRGSLIDARGVQVLGLLLEKDAANAAGSCVAKARCS